MKKPLESDFTTNGIFETGQIAKYIRSLEEYIEYLEEKDYTYPLVFDQDTKKFTIIDNIPHLPYIEPK